MSYEVPELSYRLGVYVTADTLSDAQAIAEQHGCDAVWTVTLLLGVVPVLSGPIYQHHAGRWSIVQASARCSCCQGEAPLLPSESI